MKTVCKKLLCLMLVAMLLVSAVPAAFAASNECTIELWIDGVKVKSASQSYGASVDRLPDESFEGFATQQWVSEIPAGATITVTRNSDSIPAGVVVNVVYDISEDNKPEGTKPEETEPEETEPEETEPTETEKPEESNTVNITIYEVEVNADGELLDAVQYKVVEDVDVSSYANMDAMIKAIYGKQYSDYKYRDFGDGTAQLNVWYVATKDNKSVYQLKVMFNNGTTNYKMFDIYEGEGILAAIKNAGISPKYEDHVLVGYLKNHTGNAKTYLTIYDVASDANADESGVIKVYADWREETDDEDEDFEYGEGGGLYGDDNDDPIYDVVLYIYTNGKTSSYAKKVTSSTMGRFTKDGLLTDDEVQLVVEKYFKTNSNTKYYGLFDKETWNGGHYLTRNAEYEVKLDPNKTNYVYVMVKDAKAYVADSSNPKTGDTIMIAVTTMALAAAGLVSMVELKKRKMI